MIRRLLDAGVDPNVVDPGGETALMTAARTGAPAALRAAARARRARGRTRARVRTDRADDRGPRESRRGRGAPARGRRGVERADAQGADAGVRPAVQGHRLRLGRRRHQSRRPAGSRPARRGQGRHDAAALRRARRASATPRGCSCRRRRPRAGRRQRHPAAADGACSTTSSTVARLLLVDKAPTSTPTTSGAASPLWAAVEYRNLDMNNNDQDSPTDNGVDRAPILDLITVLHRRGRQRQRAHARGAAEPALALFARRRVVGGLHRSDAVPARRALGRHGDDAAAARARRRSEPADAGRHDAADGGRRRELGRSRRPIPSRRRRGSTR